MKPIVYKVALAGSVVLFGLVLFEIAKLIFFPDINQMESLQITICFVFIISIVFFTYHFRHTEALNNENLRLRERIVHLESSLQEIDSRYSTAKSDWDLASNDRQNLLAEIRAGRERLKELTRQLVRVQEEERRHLSRELHDEAGQALTALGISLRLIHDDLDGAQESPEVIERLCEAIELTGTTMQQLRALAQDLRPPSLDTLGLSAALEGYCREFSRRTNLVISCQHEQVPELDETQNITLYRFLQEALTNVIKHANAKNVWVNLYQDDVAICLSVEDDGDGFNNIPSLEKQAIFDPKVPEVGMGLIGLRERFELLGGYIRIVSQPGKGACLVGYLPLGVDYLERRVSDGAHIYRR